LDDGYQEKTFSLGCCYKGLYIPGMIWRELENFSSGAVCLVLSSDYYDPEDYYREYPQFMESVKRENK